MNVSNKLTLYSMQKAWKLNKPGGKTWYNLKIYTKAIRIYWGFSPWVGKILGSSISLQVT